MSDEIELVIVDFLEVGYSDEQIVAALLRLYPIETAEARAILAEVLRQWLRQPQPNGPS